MNKIFTMKLTLLLISTAALAIANPIIPTGIYDPPSTSTSTFTSTNDLFPNIMMPTIVKTLPPLATPTEEPTPTELPGWLHHIEPVCNEHPDFPFLSCSDEWLESVYPNPCKEAPDRYFRFCAAVAKLEAWKEKSGM
jgi:hypothetical protein